MQRLGCSQVSDKPLVGVLTMVRPGGQGLQWLLDRSTPRGLCPPGEPEGAHQSSHLSRARPPCPSDQESTDPAGLCSFPAAPGGLGQGGGLLGKPPRLCPTSQ